MTLHRQSAQQRTRRHHAVRGQLDRTAINAMLASGDTKPRNSRRANESTARPRPTIVVIESRAESFDISVEVVQMSKSRMCDRKSRICLLAVAWALLATVSVEPQTRALAISRVNVVDVIDGQIVPNTTVTISGATITSVTPNGRTPANARMVDGRGKFLIPGLWDMHAHMEASGEAWLPLYVANGVTGIRDMGSNGDLILKMREDTASGRVLGPRIFAAGRFSMMHPANGHSECA